MNDRERREIESLVSALCDGIIESKQLERLEELLRSSPQCRQVYLRHVDMHARLTMHPHLATGIPVDVGARSQDDDVVLELARASLDHFISDAELERKRRKLLSAGRWLALVLIVASGIVAWQFADRWLIFGGGQSEHGFPVVREVAGEAAVIRADGSSPAQTGLRLNRGERLRLGNDESRAVLEYDDGTQVVVFFNSTVEVPAAASGVQLRLHTGTIQVDAAQQPKNRPLVFATDHARYVVLGTRFRLYRETAASRLELDEGKVRLERQVDGKSVDVTAGHVAVATSKSTPVDVRPLAAGRCRLRATLHKAGRSVAFSKNGKLLATSDWERGLMTWNPDDAKPIHAYKSKIGRSSGLVFHGETLVHVNRNGKQGKVMRWRPGDARVKATPLPGKNVRSRAVSPAGRYVVESGEDGTQIFQLDPSAKKPKSFATLPSKGKAWCLSLSESAKFAAAGYWDGTIRVHSPDEDRILFEMRLVHTPPHIALSDDGKLLAVYSHKDGLLLIDWKSGRQQTLWAGGAASVACLKFVDDGKRILAGLNDRTARMWSVDDGRPLLVIDAGHVPHGIAWRKKDSLIATADGRVKLWECELP